MTENDARARDAGTAGTPKRPRDGVVTGLTTSLGTTGLTNVASLLLGVVTGVLTARGLAPHDRGVLVAVTLWVGQMSVLGMAGLDEALIQRSGGRLSLALLLQRALATRNRWWLAGSIVTMLAIGALLLKPTRLSDYTTLILVALIIPVGYKTVLRLAVLRSVRRVALWNALRVLPQVVYALLLVTLVVVREMSVVTAIACLALANLVTYLLCNRAIVVLSSERHSSIGTGDSPPDDSVVESATALGRKFLYANLPFLLLQRADQLALGFFGSPAELGVYSVAVSLAGIVGSAATSAEQVLYPRFVAATPTRLTLGALAGIGFAIALVASGLLIAFAKTAISTLYGAAYLNAIEALPFLLVLAAVRAASAVFRSALKARASMRKLIQTNAVSLVTLTVAFLAGYEVAGIAGGAAGAAASGVFEFGLVYWANARSGG